jgi:tetratricopeptide (TPR) repeat protein
MAITILGECLSLSQQLYGEDHEEVANVTSALAWVYKYDGDYVLAKRTHEKSLVMRMKLFGENHASVASSLSDIGDLMNAQGKYNDALALHQKSLLLRQKAYSGERHREVALSHLSLGKLHRSQENLELAKNEYEAAGRILSQISEKDPLLATVYLELGTIRTLSNVDGNFDVSIPFFERALDILISRYLLLSLFSLSSLDPSLWLS